MAIEWLRGLLWRVMESRMESRVHAIVTERLLAFERALVDRGQIEKSYPPEPPRIRVQR